MFKYNLPVYQGVGQVAIRYTLSSLVSQLQQFERSFSSTVATGSRRLCFQIVFLNHQIREFVVIEVKLNLIVQRLLACGAKHLGAKKAGSDIPRLENDMFFPILGPAFVSIRK